MIALVWSVALTQKALLEKYIVGAHKIEIWVDGPSFTIIAFEFDTDGISLFREPPKSLGVQPNLSEARRVALEFLAGEK